MPKRLLPLIPAGLLVQQVLPTSEHITIKASPRQNAAACPDCGVASRRVHSRYGRTLADLPWQGRPVTLAVHARRFRCLNSACARQTFAERLAEVAPAAARRTERLGGVQRCLGLALGGEAGARLAYRLAMPTSADTLLRVVRAAACRDDPLPAPRVLGVDDWSWRRGHRYGTMLVDLERNAVVDLLRDRQAETLATWLRRHPGVEVVARDRAGAYADGIRQGAPAAVQVADRWHLLRNLGDAVPALVDRHAAAVRRAGRLIADTVAAAIAAEPMPPAPPRPPNAAARASQASLARRQARYEEAAGLRAKGVSISRIAARLGAERKTVRRWLRLGHAPSWKQRPRTSTLAAFADVLDRRWAEGCRNAAQLWRELVAQGFAGRPGTVRAWTTRRRGTEPAPTAPRPTRMAPAWPVPSGRSVARILMADSNTLKETERQFAARMLAEAPGLAAAIAVARRLRQVLRRKGGETLAEVLAAAEKTELASYAANLCRDIDAVQAALDLPWTTSPVEGQINRLKLIKRSMYGRAGFDLLRNRVLNAA
ncbi:ISL3 family transposase [Roseomonas mucosa]|uniref:ISL3 family transposase n=1 Tax=Roseomonas TaxID=125216 RepID=UPI0003034B40|nr:MULTISPECIES: ISL3 family transposase [Roseomonas]MDT8296422.1 ISL3 family transposase [Roseomonas mucosa]MDT8351784.1 ISL3 family transposase [Roseomonas mucosa]